VKEREMLDFESKKLKVKTRKRCGSGEPLVYHKHSTAVLSFDIRLVTLD
jgi:hypothetical protein